MRTNQIIDFQALGHCGSLVLLVIAVAACGLPGIADADDGTTNVPLWEVSVESVVDWPAIAAPSGKKPKKPVEEGDGEEIEEDEKEAEKTTEADPAPEMITERRLQSSLFGHLMEISEKGVVFTPLLGASVPITIPLERVVSLRKDTPPPKPAEEKKEPGKEKDKKNATEELPGDTGERLVTFRAGSSLPGRLLRITQQGIVLTFAEAGELTVPLSEIRSITPLVSQKGSPSIGALPAPDGRHVARLTTGEIITGNIAPVISEADRLTISSPILTGEFPLALVETLLFPEGTGGKSKDEEKPSDDKVDRVAMVTFAGGASLSSPTIQLSDGTLGLEIWKGAPFRISLKSAESISFVERGGVRPNGPIFFWGKHTDVADEFEKTQKVLQEVVVGRELNVSSGADAEPGEFDALLRRSSTFIWGEWENFDDEAFNAAMTGEGGRPLDAQLQDYVSSGGIAIFLGMSGGNVEHFQRLGLGDIISEGAIGDGSELELTGPGEALAAMMPDEFTATNSTMAYTLKEGSDWTALATEAGNPENAAVIGKRIGSGWVFLIGMDLYETNEAVTRLLLELTRFRR